MANAMKIRKRSGEVIAFDVEKILKAVERANASVSPDKRLSRPDLLVIPLYIKLQCEQMDGVPGVEDIQNMVEDEIGKRQKFDLLRSYHSYRDKRAALRQEDSTDSDILALVDDANDEMASENSNKDTRIESTKRDYIAGIVSRSLTRRKLLPEHITAAHDSGAIHFHDMDYFIQNIFNCCLINIGDMLDNGTVMNGKMIESPKSFQVACTVTSQIIACVASNQYGGQSVDMRHLGKYLRRSKEKFIRKIREECPELNEAEQKKVVAMQLREELKAGVQTIQYQSATCCSMKSAA